MGGGRAEEGRGWNQSEGSAGRNQEGMCVSWLFSRALVEAYSEGNSSDGERCAPLNVMPTQHPFYYRDRTMDFSNPSPFGLTCAVLTAGRGEALLISFREDFRARASVPQDSSSGLRILAPDFGGRWFESLARLDRASSSWKTRQRSLFEAECESLLILPRWGFAADGELWEGITSEPRIVGSESGYWPTPTASDAKAYRPKASTNIKSHGMPYQQRPAYRYAATFGMIPSSLLWDWLMGFPLGWTRLESLETHKYQRWCEQHGIAWSAKEAA
jgi:hypothetical protein